MTNELLPTVKDLCKLPMRAVVAYAARTSRRLSSVLRGVIADETIEEVLRIVEEVTTARSIQDIEQSSVADASVRIASAYAACPEESKSPERFLVVFSLTHSLLAALHAIRGAVEGANSQYEMEHVATEAERAVRSINILDSDAAEVALHAAVRDYEILLQVYGEHDAVTIGEPVSCFGSR